MRMQLISLQRISYNNKNEWSLIMEVNHERYN